MIRMRFRYAVGIELAYLSHLDLMRLLLRALRRCGLPFSFSQGFNPHPRLNLASPLPVGVTGEGEYGDIYFEEAVTPGQFLKDFGTQMPSGLLLSGADLVPLELPSLTAEVNAATYLAYPAGTPHTPGEKELQDKLKALMAREEIIIQRRNKKGALQEVNVKPYIYQVNMVNDDEKGAGLEMLLQMGSRGGVSPFVVIDQLMGLQNFDKTAWQLHRRGLYICENGVLRHPLP